MSETIHVPSVTLRVLQDKSVPYPVKALMLYMIGQDMYEGAMGAEREVLDAAREHLDSPEAWPIFATFEDDGRTAYALVATAGGLFALQMRNDGKVWLFVDEVPASDYIEVRRREKGRAVRHEEAQGLRPPR